jgi:hypothetical protein
VSHYAAFSEPEKKSKNKSNRVLFSWPYILTVELIITHTYKEMTGKCAKKINLEVSYVGQ